MVGDPPRRLQVLLHQGRRHRQRFRRVVEAGLVGGVDGELPRRPDVDARQVADGVVVLGVAQPPRQDPAGIARVPLRLVLAERLDPVDDIPAQLGLRMPLRLRRRHRSALELLQDGLPALVGPWPPLPRSGRHSGPGRPSASPCRGTRGSRSRETGARCRGSGVRAALSPGRLRRGPAARSEAVVRSAANARKRPITVIVARICAGVSSIRRSRFVFHFFNFTPVCRVRQVESAVPAASRYGVSRRKTRQVRSLPLVASNRVDHLVELREEPRTV